MARASSYWPAAARASASWNFKFGSSGLAARAARAVSTLPTPASLKPERQLGLDLLCLGLEKPAALEAEDPGLGVLEPPLLERDPRQTDLGSGQIGVER